MSMIENGARRPVIGIPVGRQLPKAAEYLRIRHTYPLAVAEAGGVPILIPPLPDPEPLRQILSIVDGLLFPGGWDVEPARFGEAAHPAVQSDEVLDALELRLAGWAVAEEVPTLGICRGQQLLNVALGGSLIQDLPSAGIPHPQSSSRPPGTGLAHRIEIESGSRLAEILGADSVEVNSFHHQAVRDLGRGLLAVAWSPDGVIEGVESTEHPWLLAVQFHPEDLVGFHEPSRRLFRAFVEACAGRVGGRPVEVA
jgi:putative glutamine amidotransferase